MSDFYCRKHIGFVNICILLFAVLVLAGCSGGGDGGGCGDSCPEDIIGTGLQGTAATGAAIANATIIVKSKSGKIQTATTDASGKFEVKELLDDGPFLMRVDKGNGELLYSIAHKTGNGTITRNIHPYTDLIVRNWFAIRGQAIDSLFSDDAAIPDMPDEQTVNAIRKEIQSIVAQVLASNGVGGDIDLLSTPFDANGKGFDAFLDNSSVVINNNRITVVINEPVTNIQNIIIGNISLDTDLTSDADSAPSTPASVRALPASESEILVVWEASADDKGVAGYNVYRNGELAGTTPYPVFSDKGLSANTDYSYEVEAVDGRGQVSARSTATASVTLDTPDTTAPPAPTDAAATVNGNELSLTWTSSQIDDVASFRVLRGAKGSATTLVATVTTTAFTDINLAGATEFCYVIKAVDAAGNESTASNETCATTGGVSAGPATLTFSAATYQVSENMPSITITVNRAGDISRAVSVSYSVTNGTAVSGEDFAATDGTLSWAANDGAAKSFVIQVISDGATEGDETVSLMLSGPSEGAILGANRTATLTITDFVTGACNSEITERMITVDTVLSEPCYKVPNGISVENPAKLTISPGVRLEFAAGMELRVRKGSSLYAVGTEAQPIVFTAQEGTPGYWQGIHFYTSNSINNQLDNVIVEYGVTNVKTSSYSFAPVRISIKNSILRYASDLGIYFDSSNDIYLDAFENNTLTLNDRPIELAAEMVGKLGKDSRYSGNTDDRVHVYAELSTDDLKTAQTWNKLDIPYYMSSARYDIQADLTLEAGVTLIFNSGAGIFVNASGSLKAIGTPDNPVLFTGLNESPGYWKGIEFVYGSNSIDNQLDYVTVEYAGGGNPSTSGGITSTCFPQIPVRFSVTNSTIKDSFGWGVYKYGDEADGCFITLTNNTYINNASGDVNTP